MTGVRWGASERYLYETAASGSTAPDCCWRAQPTPAPPALWHDSLESSDLVAMPPLPIRKLVVPRAGFWCTLVIKHLVGIRAAALRPDRLRVRLGAGSKSYRSGLGERSRVAALQKGSRPSDSALNFLNTHAQT
jgi:hypothetical protein